MTIRTTLRLCIAFALVLAVSGPSSGSDVVYEQPPAEQLGWALSSWDGDGGRFNTYASDNFTLPVGKAITGISWRGTTQTANSEDFTINFYDRDINTPLVTFHTGGDPVPVPGQTDNVRFDYQLRMSNTILQAAPGHTYYVMIVNYAPWMDWGWVAGTGGDGSYFTYMPNMYGGVYGGGNTDLAFTLYGLSGPTCYISASALPAGAGKVFGVGEFSIGKTTGVFTTPNPGFGFLCWTEGRRVVSTSPAYSFTAGGNRNLVANFVPACTVSVSPSPLFGGAAAGGGTYNVGAQATVTATPTLGYAFTHWTSGARTVSTASPYTFAVKSDTALVAHFAPKPGTAVFDFDTAAPALTPQQPTPFTQTSAGVLARFSSAADGTVPPAYDVETASSLGLGTPWCYGQMLNQFSVTAPVVDILFDKQTTGVTLSFCIADPNPDMPSLQLTAYQNPSSQLPVGTASAKATYVAPDSEGASLPAGVLTFQSPQPFTVMRLGLVSATSGVSWFVADNIIVTTIPTAASGLAVTVPSTITAGVPFTFTVTAVDAAGGIATGYTGQVRLSSTDPRASLSSAEARLDGSLPLVNGAGTFRGILSKAGAQTITAADTAAPALRATSSPITVSPGAPSGLQCSGRQDVVAGNPSAMTIQAVDPHGNLVPDYNGTVRLTSSDPLAILPADFALAGGKGSASVTLLTAGSQTVTVAGTGLLRGVARINVNVYPVARLYVTTPASVTKGVPFTFSVTALDTSGHCPVSYSGPVKFTSTDTSASLPGAAALVHGQGSFTATLNRPGRFTINAQDTTNPAIKGQAPNIMVH